MARSAAVNPLGVVAAVLVAAGAVLGVGLVEEPGTVIPATLEVAVLLGVTWLFLGRIRQRDQRRWLGRMVLLALGLRAAAMIVVHGVFVQEFFAPDAASYWYQGLVLSRWWAGAAPAPELELGTQVVYPYLNAVFHLALGDSTYGMMILNTFAGVWTMLLTYAIGRDLLGEYIGRIGAMLVAVFPSLVLWSVVNVRDALTTFMVALTTYFGLRVFRSARPGDLVGVFVGTAVLAGLRDYMGFLVLVGFILGSVCLLRRGSVGLTLATGTVLTLALVFGMQQLGLFQRVVVESPLEQAETLRRSLQQDFGGGAAGSAYGEGYRVDTVSGALRFLPVGLTYFLFAPFPWAVGSTLQLFTLPEILLWYFLVPPTVVGLWMAPGEGRSRIWLVVAVLLVVISSYALVEGNIGTAYRHRAQVMPLIFLFTGAGIAYFRERWIQRRYRERRRRHFARSSIRSGSAGP